MWIFALLSLAALVSAVLSVACYQTGNRQCHYLFKPATMIWIILLALWLTPLPIPAYSFWIIAGLCFSLAGDVLLMLPRDRFLAGLGAFLLTHCCYIAAFMATPIETNALWLLPWLAAGGVIFLLIKPQQPVVRAAVLLYIVAIVVMVWLAIENRRAYAPAALGAVLFMLSDTLIGMRRFRRDWPFAQTAILGTYFPAQWLFAISIAAPLFG